MAKDVKVGSAYVEVGYKADKLKSDKTKIENEVKKGVKAIEDSAAKIKPSLETEKLKKDANKVKNEVNKELKSISIDGDKISKGVDLIKNSLVALAGATAIKWSLDVMKKSAELENLREAFAGNASDMENFRKATARTVSDADLLKMSNMATDLGLSLEQQAIFFNMAENAGDKYGGGIEGGMNKIIRATEGATRGLSQLGIQKKVYEKIVNDLAKAYGGEINELDAETQKQIRLQALLKASGQTMEDVNKKLQDNADKLEAAAVSWTTLETSIGKLLNSPTMMKFIDIINKAVKGWSYIMGAKPENLVDTKKEYYNSVKGSSKEQIEAEKKANAELLAIKNEIYNKADYANKTTKFTPGDVIGKKLKNDVDEAKKELDNVLMMKDVLDNLETYRKKWDFKQEGGGLSDEAKKARADKALQEREKALQEYDVKDNYYYQIRLDRIKKEAAEIKKQLGEIAAARYKKTKTDELDREYIPKIKPKGTSVETWYEPMGGFKTPTQLQPTVILENQDEIRKELAEQREYLLSSASQFSDAMANAFDKSGKGFLSWINTALQAALQISKILDSGKGASAGGILGMLTSVIPFFKFAHTGGDFVGTGSGVMRMAGGGSFVVPSGFPNDSFPLMVESGERVSVTSTNRMGQESQYLKQLIDRVDTLNAYTISNANKSNNGNIRLDAEIKNESIYLSNKKALRQYGRTK